MQTIQISKSAGVAIGNVLSRFDTVENRRNRYVLSGAEADIETIVKMDRYQKNGVIGERVNCSLTTENGGVKAKLLINNEEIKIEVV